MRKQISFIGLFSFFSLLLWGQDANPFEIIARMPKVENNQQFAPENPFDIVPHSTPSISEAFTEELTNQTQEQENFFSFPEGNNLSKTTLFGLLILMLLYFTFAAATNRTAMTKSWKSFLSSNALNTAQREAFGLAGTTPYLLLYANFLLNAGVFVFLVIQAININGRYNNLEVLLLSLFISILVFLLKHFENSALGWLFPPLSTDFKKYSFLIISFSCVLGLFLVPFNFLIAFAGSKEWQTFVTVWLLALSIIFILYGLIRALSLGLKYLVTYPFHFLLYLCAAELVPVLFITKLVFF
ncbi:MAG: hypothetical protein RL728_440 [Bacteroidota bacterium]|jgi:hypothetical protein